MIKTCNNKGSVTREEKEMEYSILDVEQHRTVHDFWTVVDGVVYDLTGMHHPGGSIYMSAAGADCSVLFHTYHVMDPEKARALLLPRRIGILVDNDHAVVEMGDFYRACAQAVRETLRDKPRRPGLAKFYWFLDMVLKTSLLVAAFFLHTTSTPLWLLIVVHLAISQMNFMRLGGQLHANGHLQLWKSDTCVWWAEFYGLIIGGLPSWGMPNQLENEYEFINKPLSDSPGQYNYGYSGTFGHHTAIHHTKGAQVQHDACFETSTMHGILRLSHGQPYFGWWHSMQSNFWFCTVVDWIAEVAESTALLTNLYRLVYIFKRLLPQGEYLRSAALVGGILTSFPALWCYLALPCSSHPYAIYICLGIAVIKEYLGLFAIQAFFAQHVWDYSVPDAVVHTDWGRYNAESSYSWWPVGWDWLWLPILWGNWRGATPSTLSFHLEHTLFPGICYLYYPEIAPVVRAVCQEHGVCYNGLYSFQHVIKARWAMLKHYGAGPQKTKSL